MAARAVPEPARLLLVEQGAVLQSTSTVVLPVRQLPTQHSAVEAEQVVPMASEARADQAIPQEANREPLAAVVVAAALSDQVPRLVPVLREARTSAQA